MFDRMDGEGADEAEVQLIAFAPGEVGPNAVATSQLLERGQAVRDDRDVVQVGEVDGDFMDGGRGVHADADSVTHELAQLSGDLPLRLRVVMTPEVEVIPAHGNHTASDPARESGGDEGIEIAADRHRVHGPRRSYLVQLKGAASLQFSGHGSAPGFHVQRAGDGHVPPRSVTLSASHLLTSLTVTGLLSSEMS